jgi:hypothetical protein
VAISKDRHARIIIMRPEITLHSEAGYIFADCSHRNRFFLQFGGGPYMLRQLMFGPASRLKPDQVERRCRNPALMALYSANRAAAAVSGIVTNSRYGMTKIVAGTRSSKRGITVSSNTGVHASRSAHLTTRHPIQWLPSHQGDYSQATFSASRRKTVIEGF